MKSQKTISWLVKKQDRYEILNRKNRHIYELGINKTCEILVKSAVVSYASGTARTENRKPKTERVQHRSHECGTCRQKNILPSKLERAKRHHVRIIRRNHAWP